MYTFKNILCVVGTDEVSKQALQHAMAVAEAQQAELTLVSVIEDLPQKLELQDDFLAGEKIMNSLIAERRQHLKDMVASLDGSPAIQQKVLTGTAFISIIYEVLRNQHDLVIKVADNKGRLQSLFGSLDMHLLRKCPVPLWLTKGAAPRVHRRILAAVDVNDFYPEAEMSTRQDLNRHTLDIAAAVAEYEQAELYVVSVWEAIAEDFMRAGVVTPTQGSVDNYVDSVNRRYRANMHELMDESGMGENKSKLSSTMVQSVLLKGAPRKKIPEFAEEIDADLVVMGTVARTGISGLIMGNTAETILNELQCSVLAVKPPGFMSPVKLED